MPLFANHLLTWLFFVPDRVDGDIRAFKEYVRTIWFGLYPRDGKNLGSSGFEHVYLGEFKKGISGFHSWLRFYKEELGGRMNYLGYIRNIDLGHGVRFPDSYSI